ncbi:uncharacterized protein PHALS_14671 [Plasmopara halstedii]|uniref:Uncharacterized protein n=1 Tax=Plasmopara halstedii TaxID=4781 RepID=A0A0P1AP64_PLAHL|nr:uncharacterized protein PHALS_14671 [Plasmopara halstedii]CEG42965.1 hypothetical protein PHALS_14671 [Plasmopara halstedii]|eukprot:XP_024579334.1 hypothetical protein PHALS_14671 [Plasmopara halstedii]
MSYISGLNGAECTYIEELLDEQVGAPAHRLCSDCRVDVKGMSNVKHASSVQDLLYMILNFSCPVHFAQR